ncbi:MAG: hypothetical protein K0R66_1117 [Gammaproteobacteria bacterium]|nr:hypothetical protein [Gammaproteobacteria bacterium]
MHIQLLIPDLLFSRPGNQKGAHPLFELDLPSLSMLLDGAVDEESLLDEEYNLAKSCGLDVASPHGVAALSAEYEGLSGKEGSWLRADPVRMQISQDSIYCLGQHNLNLASQEAQALIDSINELLQEEGLHLCMGNQPLHWYVQLTEELHTVPLSRVIGKPILDYLPKNRAWQKRLTEIQMLLKTHPVNTQRQKLHLPTVDSLWLWGQGQYPRLLRSRKDVMYADSDFAKALALASNLPCFPIPEQMNQILDGPYQKILFISHQLKLALEAGDLAKWQAQVLKLEQGLFLPLLLALKNKVIDSIVLDFCKGRGHSISRRNLRKWWKRPLSLQSRLGSVDI